MPHKTLKAMIAASAVKLSNLLYNQALGAAGLAEGTGAQTLQVASAFNFVVNGITYQKAITDNIAMTAAAQQAVSTYCRYLCSINSSGAVTITKGTESAVADGSTLPSCPANQAPFAEFKVATDASHTFTSGTTDLAAAGITATFADEVLTPDILINPVYGACIKDFAEEKARAVSYRTLPGNVGSCFYGGSNVASDGSIGTPIPAQESVWDQFGSVVSSNVNLGLIDLRTRYVHGNTAGDFVVIEIGG